MNKIRRIDQKAHLKATLLVAAIVVISAASTRLQADTGTCGGASISLPFSDVAAGNVFFCSIAEAYFSALTNGTTGTTYAPGANVTRDQMAAFITRTLDQSLKRSSIRAALDQNWTTQTANNLALTAVGTDPRLVKSDGSSLWVANFTSDSVSKVQAVTGKVLETWTGADNATGVLCALNKVFVTGASTPGKLYQIDPTLPAGGVTVLSSALGNGPQGIAYDGQRIWTANNTSVSIVTLNPFAFTNVTGFTDLTGIIYDGSNMWVTDNVAGTVDKLHKLDSGDGHILLSVNVGNNPRYPIFDGTNIWVPNFTSNSVMVVRPSTAAVIETLTGNGLLGPLQVAFDGERILVTNAVGNGISLWSATALTPIGNFSTGAGSTPLGACSDGINFWITLNATGMLARF